jgi:lactate permease
MIDAQSIVVAAIATGQSGGEGRILRFVFLHSIVLAGLVGLLTLVQAYLLPWMIPAAQSPQTFTTTFQVRGILKSSPDPNGT